MVRRRAREAEVEEGSAGLLETLADYSPLRFLPEETRRHVRSAQREMLLAVRTLIDQLVEEIDAAEQRRERRTTKVHVE